MNRRTGSSPSESPRRAFATLLLNEARLAKRLPYGLFLGLGLPFLLLIIFGSIPALHQRQAALGGMSYFAASVPTLIGFAITATAFIALPSTLVSYREQGVLRRLSVTPVPPWWLLAAQVVVNVAIAVLGLIALMVVGVAAFGLASPKDLVGFVVTVLLTVTSLFAIGIWLTAIARSNASSRAIGALLFYIALFFGGLWVPREAMPPSLKNISNWTPLGASVAGLQNAIQGHFPSLQSLCALLAYTVVFGYLAVRYFRWE